MIGPIAIDDPADPRIAEYFELTDPAARSRRERDRFFVAEGATAIERLVGSGHRVRSVLVTPAKLDRLAGLLDGVDAPVFVASRAVMAETVGFALHRGAIAVADRRPARDLTDLLPQVSTIAVLEGLNDPENLGAIARSARAFGVEALVLDPTCIDPYYRRIVRVSMGEVLFLPVARAESWPAALDIIADHGFETWALTPVPEAASIWSLATPPKLAMVFGAEGPGLTTAATRHCSRTVRIPIEPHVDSLNVAAAAAVAFAERARRLATRPRR